MQIFSLEWDGAKVWLPVDIRDKSIIIIIIQQKDSFCLEDVVNLHNFAKEGIPFALYTLHGFICTISVTAFLT